MKTLEKYQDELLLAGIGLLIIAFALISGKYLSGWYAPLFIIYAVVKSIIKKVKTSKTEI